MPVIEVQDLVVRYGARTAVDGLSLSAEAGEVLALLGPNGAGKTSTVEVLEGYRRPAAGTARVLGLDPIAEHARLTPHIGVMLQSGGVYPGIRPGEMLRLLAAFYPQPEDPVALLERVGLTDRASTAVRKLSGGEQQRLSLAMAMVGRPRVAFLDEPTAGIDVGGRQLVRRVIGELRDAGVCVLLTTHDLDEAQRVADRVVIIDRGRVLAQGTPDELMRSGGPAEIRFGAPAGIDTAGLGAALGAAVDEVAAGEYRIGVEATPANVAAVTGWLAEHDLPLADLRAGRHSLADVFTRLTAPDDDDGADDGAGDGDGAPAPRPSDRRRARRGPGGRR